MILALALSLAVQGSDQPVSVKINHRPLSSGDHARVYVETAQDGYLAVLHADPDGRIRVLFPTDPRDDDFIRGGRRFEVRGRSDRDAFQVEGDEGSGTVLAAVSSDPLNFDAFVRNDHWDFRALGGPSRAVTNDPLAQLLDIVQRMSGDSSGRFDYDRPVSFPVRPRTERSDPLPIRNRGIDSPGPRVAPRPSSSPRSRPSISRGWSGGGGSGGSSRPAPRSSGGSRSGGGGGGGRRH